jgi:cell division protein FtsL
MFNINLFFIIFVLFIIFIIFQICFYSKIYNKNRNLIDKVESFKSSIDHIDNKKDYILDDKSLQTLLEDYNNLKNNI